MPDASTLGLMDAPAAVAHVRGSIAGLGRRAHRGVRRYGTLAFLQKIAVRPLRPVLAPLAGRKLRQLAERAGSKIDALIDVAYRAKPFEISIEPGQLRPEIRGLLERLVDEQPRRVLEIGTAQGGSLFLVSHVLAPGAHLISVDLPEGEFGGGYPAWRIPLYKQFVPQTHRLDLIRGNSHAPGTLDRVRALLGGEQLDLLFVDGDHTYDGVRQDFETYSTLVRPGGLVAFHDITPASGTSEAGGPLLLVGDVPRFWREIRARYAGEELVGGNGAGCFGIGLIRV